MSYNELKMHGTADFPIELYHIDKFHPNYEMPSHWHSETEIIRISEGILNVKINNRFHKAEKGDIIFVNPESIHGAVPEECVYECIDFHTDFLSVQNNGCQYFFEGMLSGEISVFEIFDRQNQELYSAVNAVFSEMSEKTSGYKFKVIGALYGLFGVIIDSHLYSNRGSASLTPENKSVIKLKNVLSFIRSNFDSQLSLAEMSDAAGMSPKYFCSYFKNMTGLTPVKYLNTYRIEKASRMLIATDYSITDIAYSCGFNDLSYFIKTFKALKGFTPADFRNSV